MGKKKLPGVRAYTVSSLASVQPTPPSTIPDATQESVVAIKQTDDEQPSLITATHEPFTLLISEEIYTMRLQNGLRHNDVSRYHHYCSRRLFHIRSKLKFKNGRHRYLAKPFPANFTDPRFLQIYLISAERSWAAYLELKAKANSDQQKKFRTVWKLAKRRLAKASVYASQLLEQSERHSDKLSILEARAYLALFQGTSPTEKAQWTEAMPKLLEARNLYLQLKRLYKSPTHLTAIQDMLSSIDGHIRTVSYYLAREGIDVASMQTSLEGYNNTTPIDTVETQITTPDDANNGIDIDVMWRGIPVKVSQKLLHSSSYPKIEEALCATPLISDFLSLDIKKLGWKGVINRMKPSQEAIAQCQHILHESMLLSIEESDNNPSASMECFLLETLVHDLEKCVLIEVVISSIGFLIAQELYLSAGINTSSHYSIAVYLSNIVLQLFASLDRDISTCRVPAVLEEPAAKTSEVLRELIASWVRLFKDCKAILMCFALKDHKSLEAYVLMQELKRRKIDRQDLELNLPDSKFWVNSPFRRIGSFMCSVDELVSKAIETLEIETSIAVAESQGSEQKFNANSNDIECSKTKRRSIDELCDALAKSVDFSTDQMKFQVIPSRPVFYDIANAELKVPNLDKYCTVNKEGLVGRFAAAFWRR